MGTTCGFPVSLPAGARQSSSPILIINSLLLIPGRGGGTGPRWGVVRVSRVSPARAATGLPRMKPAGARRWCPWGAR